MSNVFWRCILEGAPEMQRKNQKKRQAKRKKHVRHVNIFMVIPHNLRNALGSSEIFKMDCICIRQGVEGRGECARRVGVGRKKDSTCRIWNRYANVVRSARFLLSKGWLEVLTFSPSVLLSFPASLSLTAMMMHVLFACKHDKNSN